MRMARQRQREEAICHGREKGCKAMAWHGVKKHGMGDECPGMARQSNGIAMK